MYLQRIFLFALVFLISLVHGYLPPKKTTIPCDKDSECEQKIPFTFCADNTAYSSGVCSCRKDYVLRDLGGNFDCLEEAKLFNDPCQIDDQCKPKFGEEAGCINQKCRCKPGAHFINLLCWKSSKLGESCGNPNNCIATDNSECNGICKCLPGFTGNQQYTKCLKIAQKLGDPCEESVQCTPVHSFATCSFNVCLCQSGYMAQGNACVPQPRPQPQPVPQPQPAPPPRYNSGSQIKECGAIFAISLLLFYFHL